MHYATKTFHVRFFGPRILLATQQHLGSIRECIDMLANISCSCRNCRPADLFSVSSHPHFFHLTGISKHSLLSLHEGALRLHREDVWLY
jgi:hypothetical protein